MNSRLIGGIMLIVGTSIGGGMLALPIATSQAGFIYSSILLFGSWVIMTISALFILEVNLWLPSNSNLISMAKATIGPVGAIVTWISYFLLLYALLAAYIAGGGDFLHGILQGLHINLPGWATAVLFASLLGAVIYHGIRSVDYVNRGLLFSKLAAFLLIVIVMLPFISTAHLIAGELKYAHVGVTVIITSFGFATIVPSIRSYFNDNLKQLRTAILVGSLIPLVCYILWDLAVMGILPHTGDHGLVTMLKSSHTTGALVTALIAHSNYKIIAILITIFTAICLATSFLGVGLCLSDFLSDGLNIRKVGLGNVWINLLTLLPPLVIVLFYPNAFIKALSYAGMDCIILLVLLPVLMVWYGRYHKKIATGYRVAGGKPLIIVLFVLGLLLIGQAML